MIKIAICDDLEEMVSILNKLVLNYIEIHHELAEITLYSQSRLLQYDIQEGKYFDLILSDIEMPYMDGMELARYIRTYLPEALIVFITSYLKYSVDAFELSIFRYIPKNSLKTRLPQVLRDAFRMIQLQSEQYYTICTATRLEKISLRKIIYIQREGKNAVFYLMDGSETRERKSLTQVHNDLNSTDFVYIDRGSIVNLSHIMTIRDGMIEIEDGSKIPASHARLELVKKELQKFWSEQL